MSANADLEVGLEEGFEAELDEQWSYVRRKSNQRWLWYAVDHATNTVLAYVFGRCKDEVFKQLKALLTPFGITRYFTGADHPNEPNSVEARSGQYGKISDYAIVNFATSYRIHQDFALCVTQKHA